MRADTITCIALVLFAGCAAQNDVFLTKEVQPKWDSVIYPNGFNAKQQPLRTDRTERVGYLSEADLNAIAKLIAPFADGDKEIKKIYALSEVGKMRVKVWTLRYVFDCVRMQHDPWVLEGRGMFHN